MAASKRALGVDQAVTITRRAQPEGDGMAAPTEIPLRRRIDWVSAAVAFATVAALVGSLWYRSGRPAAPGPLAIGDPAPPLRLLDLKTSEPLVLLGSRGKVVWIIFWSADSPSGRSSLPELQRVWVRLKAHRQFALLTAAVEADQPGRVRTAVAESGVELPVYLASSETRQRFSAEQADPPLHIMIDAQGHVMALARGADRQTIERFADLARRQLDELDPLGATRFASMVSFR